MYQPPHYGCRPPPQDPLGPPPGYGGPPSMGWGPPGPARHPGRGPYWRPNIPPPGPGIRMPWSQGGPPMGPGPCGGPPWHGPPPGHQMSNRPPPPGFQMSHNPLPNFAGPGNHFQGSMKRKHPGNNSQKKKKPFVDKRELPENNAFFCDTCDRGFKTEDKYTEHVQDHEQCSVEGCPFVAAPKLVAMHYNLQHRTGLAKQIWKLESQEEVDNWLASRRRNYPTASNMAKKQADLKAREERGEVLTTKQFGRMRGGRGRGRGRGRGWQGSRGGRQDSPAVGSWQPQEDVSEGATHPTHQLSSQPNTDHLESHLPHAGDRKDSTQPSCNALGSIVASYGSDNDDDATSAEPPESTVNNENKLCGIPIQKKSTKSNRRNKRGQKQQQQKQRIKTQTLLEKLLAGDIRHERNVILQCVRYIAKHNFFNEKLGNTLVEKITPEEDKLHEQTV